MNAITNLNYVNYVPVSVSVFSCFIGSQLGLMTPLTAAAYDFGTRYLFSEGCEGRASCNCCEERMSREGGGRVAVVSARGGRVAIVFARKECLAKGVGRVATVARKYLLAKGGGRVAVVSARKHLLAGEGRQLMNKDIHGMSR